MDVPASVAPSVGDDARVRLRAGLISLGVSVVLLGAKYTAYRLTGSTAILSDALESIVNVVAAVFALGGLVFAGRPADRSHPYGHGKIEFFSAAFEGGLIAFAAVLIMYEVAQSLIRGVEIQQLGAGLAIVIAAGLVNLALGLFLVRTGRRASSLTLVADGQHVLSDFWTSVGIVVGLVLVRLTGLAWLDPVVAALVALNLMWTGWRLVRHAAGGLLDEEDTALLNRLREVLDRRLGGGVIRVHHLARHPLRALSPRGGAPGGAGVLVGGARPRAVRDRRRAGDRGARGRGRAGLSHRSLSPDLLRHVRSRRLSGAARALPRAPGPHARRGGPARYAAVTPIPHADHGDRCHDR